MSADKQLNLDFLGILKGQETTLYSSPGGSLPEVSSLGNI